MKFIIRRKVVLAVLAVAPIGGATTGVLFSAREPKPASADEAIFLTKDEAAESGSPAEVVAKASEAAGFKVRTIAVDSHRLGTVSVSFPPEGVESSLRWVTLLYAPKKDGREGDRIIVTHSPLRRDSAVSFGREKEPEPVGMRSNVAGLDIVRVDSDGVVAFTARTATETLDIGFYPPLPEDEMLRIVESAFKGR